MADGTVQVPPDSTGKKIDGAALDVGVNLGVIRQRIIIGDNTSPTGFAAVSNGALVVTGGMNVSGTVIVSSGNFAITNNPSVTVLAGAANIGGVSLVAGTSNIGYIDRISATVSTVVGAGTANIGGVSLVAGTANIGFLNHISATVSVVLVAGTANIGTLNGISATVVVTTANTYIVNIPSVSHGPKCVTISTSATVTLVTAPGAGFHVYVTSMAAVNFSTTTPTKIFVGPSNSVSTIVMPMATTGGGFVWNFDPPWKLLSNEPLLARVKPNASDVYCNFNFYVGP